MYKINRYLKEINNRVVYFLISFLLTSGLFYFFLNEFYYILTQLFSSSRLTSSIDHRSTWGQSDNIGRVSTNLNKEPFISEIYKEYSPAYQLNNQNSYDKIDSYADGVAVLNDSFDISLVQAVQNNFIFTDITEAFQTSILSIILISFLIHVPFVIYHIWCFIIPSFFQQEKNFFTFYSKFFLFQYFLSNLFIIYLVFPISWDFFSTFEINNRFLNIHSEIKLSSYISFLLKILSLNHFIFQIPFFVSVLLKFQILKIIDLKNIFSFRKYIFWCLILFSSIVAPPDFFVQLSISIFFFIVFEVSFFFILIFSQYR